MSAGDEEGEIPSGVPSEMGWTGWTHLIQPGETFEISFPMPPMPCHRCGEVDLRGKKAYLVEPHETEAEGEDGEGEGGTETAYYLACEECSRWPECVACFKGFPPDGSAVCPRCRGEDA